MKGDGKGEQEKVRLQFPCVHWAWAFSISTEYEESWPCFKDLRKRRQFKTKCLLSAMAVLLAGCNLSELDNGNAVMFVKSMGCLSARYSPKIQVAANLSVWQKVFRGRKRKKGNSHYFNVIYFHFMFHRSFWSKGKKLMEENRESVGRYACFLSHVEGTWMRISQKKRHFHSCLDISLVHNLEANTANDSSEQNTPLILGLQ